MLTIKRGDLFADRLAQALVNPVNCKGVMGAGVARVFKARFYRNYIGYRAFCQAGKLRPGGAFVTDVEGVAIINLATKDRWQDPSRLEWIAAGIETLASICEGRYHRVALPMIGAGYGGLASDDVLALLRQKLSDSETHYSLWVRQDKTGGNRC